VISTSTPTQHNPQVVRGFLGFARVAAALMIVVGFAALVGAHWNIPPLTSVFPGHQNMKAASAVGFMASGVALLASLRPGRQAQALSLGLSLLVLAVGAANLGASYWQIDLGYEHLFDDPFALSQGKPPGRLSPATASAFVLLGILGLLVAAKRGLWLREALAISLLATGMLGLAYGFAKSGEITAALNPLAIQTAVLLLVGPLGWMASLPTQGLTGVATADTVGCCRRCCCPWPSPSPSRRCRPCAVRPRCSPCRWRRCSPAAPWPG